MKIRLSAAIAIAFGLTTLLGYFVRLPQFIALQLQLTEWAATLAAAALLVGLVNLLSVHWRKVVTQGSNWLYSIFLVLALLVTFGLTLWQGPGGAAPRWILNYIQVPVESALAAVVSVALLVAGIRLLRSSSRRNLMSLVFLAVALFVLLGSGPLPGANTAFLEEIRAWLAQVPAVAGARGILLGVALGALATGLRILMGTDRPYSD